MTLKLIAAACGLSLCLVTAAHAEGTAQAGQAKSATCVACHGVDGNSVNPEWPKLAGQHPEYIVKQLQAFKSGARKNPLMSPMAAPLSDQDMEDLAAYFSSQTTKGGEAEPSKVSAGQRLYRGGDANSHTPACLACHGPNGRGNPPALYPSIRGQQATYVAAQLRAYKSGARTTDQNQMMRNVAASLSDEEIDAVASYIQGLR
jgi:cytochrome c553